jgi:hypothetical protein
VFSENAVSAGLTATFVPAQLPQDFFPGRFRTETKIFQHASCHTITFKEQAQEDMFGPDGSVVGSFGLPRG